MTDWDAALEQEEGVTPPEVKLDRYSFYRGWLWGRAFEEYCRWFKIEYWQQYIRDRKNAPSK